MSATSHSRLNNVLGQTSIASYHHYKNPDKSLQSFPPCIYNHLCSFASRFLFLQTHATSYSFYSSVTVKEKGGKTVTNNHTPFFPMQEIHAEISSLRTLKIMPKNLNEIVCLWIWLQYTRDSSREVTKIGAERHINSFSLEAYIYYTFKLCWISTSFLS